MYSDLILLVLTSDIECDGVGPLLCDDPEMRLVLVVLTGCTFSLTVFSHTGPPTAPCILFLASALLLSGPCFGPILERETFWVVALFGFDKTGSPFVLSLSFPVPPLGCTPLRCASPVGSVQPLGHRRCGPWPGRKERILVLPLWGRIGSSFRLRMRVSHCDLLTGRRKTVPILAFWPIFLPFSSLLNHRCLWMG